MHLSIGRDDCGTLAVDVDATAGSSSRVFLFLVPVAVEIGHDLLTFLVRGIMGAKIGQRDCMKQ